MEIWFSGWRGWLVRFGMILVGLACAGGMVLLVFQVRPELRPGGQRFVFTDLDGDTFRHQPGFVRPPAQNRTLEDFILRYDSDGFRLPKKTADHYPILVLGDSFTEGGQTNWVDVLAATLDTPVRNLGWRGFGPLEEVEIMRQYGGDDSEWVLMAYFEGNDLSNIQTADEYRERNGHLNISREAVRGSTVPAPVLSADGNYLYPLTHIVGEQTSELAYISDYLWWLNGPIEVYQESHNIELLAQALRDLKILAGSACVGLVYIPSKEHLYFEYSDPVGNRRYVLENGLSLSLDADGWLSFGPLTPQDEGQLMANLDNQRDAVQAVAEEAGLIFIDLLPAFQIASVKDAPTYYLYDSHWNADGHELAGKTVAAALQNIGTCRE